MEQVNSCNAKTKWYDYFFLLFIILWSGGGFTYGLLPFWMIYLLPIITISFINRGFSLSKKAIVLIVIITVILILQKNIYQGNFSTIIKPICTLLICAMYAKIISHNFAKVYFDIIYSISFICLMLWIICLIPTVLTMLRSISTSLPPLGWNNFENSTNIVDTLYIFNIPREYDRIMRNSGPFWEPGRFTIYITIALAINLFNFKESIFSKKNIILILTNITTFSTSGYIATMILFVGYILSLKSRLSNKIILSLILTAVIYYVTQLDFMIDKITMQSADDTTWSRFGAISYHWYQIIESPIIGYGPFLLNKYSDLQLSPNGITDLLRYYGIPLSLYMYYLLYRSTMMLVKKNILCVFIAVLALCFSQTITYSPFFYLMYFLSFNICKRPKMTYCQEMI